MREKVEEVLDKIRPALMSDGGNVELVDVADEHELNTGKRAEGIITFQDISYSENYCL